MLLTEGPFQYSSPGDLALDRVLYLRNRSKNVITARNPRRVEYQAEPTVR